MQAAIAKPAPPAAELLAATDLPLTQELTREDHNLLYSILETHGSADGLLQILSNCDTSLPEALGRLTSPRFLQALHAIALITHLREQIILAQCRITAIQTLDRLATRDLSDSKANPETVRKSAAQLLRTKSSPARHAEDEPPPSPFPSSFPSTANPRVSASLTPPHPRLPKAQPRHRTPRASTLLHRFAATQTLTPLTISAQKRTSLANPSGSTPGCQRGGDASMPTSATTTGTPEPPTSPTPTQSPVLCPQSSPTPTPTLPP